MTHAFTLRRAAVISALLICVLGWACGSPTSPSSGPQSTGVASTPPPPSPPPAPTFVRYNVSGVVTDESGAPLPGVSITVDYPPGGSFASPPGRCVQNMLCLISTSSNGRGEYELSFEPGPGIIFMADVAGLAYSYSDGFEQNLQVLPRGTTEIRQTLRLRQERRVNAGQSVAVAIERDSTMCTDLEDWWLLTYRCEILNVLVGETATLTVEARGVQGGDSPRVFFATTGRYTTTQGNEPGRATVGVEAGQRYKVFIGTPVGNAPTRFDVSTSLR